MERGVLRAVEAPTSLRRWLWTLFGGWKSMVLSGRSVQPSEFDPDPRHVAGSHNDIYLSPETPFFDCFLGSIAIDCDNHGH